MEDMEDIENIEAMEADVEVIHQPFVIPAPHIHRDNAGELRAILEEAKEYCRAPISDFHVAAIAVGDSGQAYLGVNLEFSNQPLSQTIHAEQFAIALARLNGETGIRQLVVSAMPCGHCRQFLLEVGHAALPITVVEDEDWHEFTLDTLLPHPFTLADSDLGMMSPDKIDMHYAAKPTLGELAPLALEAVSQSYAPYTESYAGAVIRTEKGDVYHGYRLESAAFNPTLSAVQVALIHMVASHGVFHQMREVLLVEKEGSKDSTSGNIWGLIKSLSPLAQIEFANAVLQEL